MKIWRDGSYGNAHFVMAKVRECLIGAGRGDEYPALAEKMRAGSYKQLCQLAKEATYGSVEVVDEQDEADL